jgi:hypothetical protein
MRDAMRLHTMGDIQFQVPHHMTMTHMAAADASMVGNVGEADFNRMATMDAYHRMEAMGDMHRAATNMYKRAKTDAHHTGTMVNVGGRRAAPGLFQEIVGPRSAQGLITISAVFVPENEKYLLPAHSLAFAKAVDTPGHVRIGNYSPAGVPQPIVGVTLEDALDASKLMEEHESRRTVAIAVGGVVALHCPVEVAEQFMFGDPVVVCTTSRGTFQKIDLLVPHKTSMNSGYCCRIGTFVEQIDAKRGGIRFQMNIQPWEQISSAGGGGGSGGGNAGGSGGAPVASGASSRGRRRAGVFPYVRRRLAFPRRAGGGGGAGKNAAGTPRRIGRENAITITPEAGRRLDRMLEEAGETARQRNAARPDSTPSAPLPEPAPLEEIPELSPEQQFPPLPEDPRKGLADKLTTIGNDYRDKTITSDQAIARYRALVDESSDEQKKLIVRALLAMMDGSRRAFFQKLLMLDVVAAGDGTKKDFVDTFNSQFDFGTSQTNFAEELQRQFDAVCADADAITCKIIGSVKDQVLIAFDATEPGLEEDTDLPPAYVQDDATVDEVDDRLVEVDVAQALEEAAAGGGEAAGFFGRLGSALQSGAEAVGESSWYQAFLGDDT